MEDRTEALDPHIQVQVSTGAHVSCVTLGQLFHILTLSFLVSQAGMIMLILQSSSEN